MRDKGKSKKKNKTTIKSLETVIKALKERENERWEVQAGAFTQDSRRGSSQRRWPQLGWERANHRKSSKTAVQQREHVWRFSGRKELWIWRIKQSSQAQLDLSLSEEEAVYERRLDKKAGVRSQTMSQNLGQSWVFKSYSKPKDHRKDNFNTLPQFLPL